MEVQIHFDILSTELCTISVVAKATLSGSYRPATFYHETEDGRECYVDDILFYDEDGEELSGSDKLKEIVYENVDDCVMQIYNDALAYDDENDIYISDFKSDHNYATLTGETK